MIALFLLGHQARDEADNRVRGELLAELLSPGDTISTRSDAAPTCSAWTSTPTSSPW